MFIATCGEVYGQVDGQVDGRTVALDEHKHHPLRIIATLPNEDLFQINNANSAIVALVDYWSVRVVHVV